MDNYKKGSSNEFKITWTRIFCLKAIKSSTLPVHVRFYKVVVLLSGSSAKISVTVLPLTTMDLALHKYVFDIFLLSIQAGTVVCNCLLTWRQSKHQDN